MTRKRAYLSSDLCPLFLMDASEHDFSFPQCVQYSTASMYDVCTYICSVSKDPGRELDRCR